MTEQSPPIRHTGSPRPPPRHGLFVAMVAAMVAICGVFGVLLIDSRADTRRAAEASELNLATALAHDLDRDLELLDLSMQAARDGWLNQRVRALAPDIRQMTVFDHSVSAHDVDAVLVIDAGGSVVADSRSVEPRPGQYRGSDFFEAQRGADAGLFVGRPFRSGGKAGWRVALSRRMTDRDGAFAGVVAGIVDLDDFGEAFRRLPLGADGALILFNTDGTLLVREPEMPGAVGRSFIGQSTFVQMMGADAGVFEGISTLDGRSRLYAFHRVGRLPLIQSVAASSESVYAGWRAKAVALVTVLAVLCSGVLFLLVALRRELLQRASAEAALEVMASTDPLTGLPNRRRFFERAEAICAEAARRGAALAVIMIDADHFKAYNDRYGHVAGDAVLREFGRCIRRALGPEDLAARYGGEEFVVLLAGRDRAEALAVADAVRSEIARLAMAHDRAPAGRVTVSAGVAGAEGGAFRDLGALIEAADAELYRSKREGRDRISVVRLAGSRVA